MWKRCLVRAHHVKVVIGVVVHPRGTLGPVLSLHLPGVSCRDVAEIAADLALVGQVLAEPEAVLREIHNVDKGVLGPCRVTRDLEFRACLKYSLQAVSGWAGSMTTRSGSWWYRCFVREQSCTGREWRARKPCRTTRLAVYSQ